MERRSVIFVSQVKGMCMVLMGFLVLPHDQLTLERYYRMSGWAGLWGLVHLKELGGSAGKYRGMEGHRYSPELKAYLNHRRIRRAT